jgi:beta-phosphoglucomutase family hydrolase
MLRSDPLSLSTGPIRLAPGLGLIFDLDGVVVDSMPVHQIAWRRYLESIGIDPKDIVPRMHGQRNDEIVRGFLGPEAPQNEVLEHGAAKERLFRQIMGERLRESLVPGITQWLERTAGSPVALASNAERPNIDFVLDGAGLRSYFRVIVDGSQVTRPKPAPDVYLRAARELRLPPGHCIVFEDSPVGVSAARAAGMRVVGVLTHSGPLADIQFAVSDFHDPELERWLSAQHAE